MNKAWIGLGSNLGASIAILGESIQHIAQLERTRLDQVSPAYRTRAWGVIDQPDFINAVALLETRLSPLALLDQLQALEQRHRRVRARRWGPRTLDLDLLLFDDSTLALPRLVVPHPDLTHRAFVVVPLLELAPQLALPNGERLAAAADALTADGLTPLLPDA